MYQVDIVLLLSMSLFETPRCSSNVVVDIVWLVCVDPSPSHLTASSPSGFTLQSSDSAVVRRSSRDPLPAFTPWTNALNDGWRAVQQYKGDGLLSARGGGGGNMHSLN